MRAKPRRSAAEPNIFDFRPRQAPRVRRAWERAPASPRAPGRKGKKVWKRAGPRAAADEASNADDGGDAAFHGHGVKRQRTKHMPAVPARATRKNQQFVSTLQDQAPGTPKSTQSVAGPLGPPPLLPQPCDETQSPLRGRHMLRGYAQAADVESRESGAAQDATKQHASGPCRPAQPSRVDVAIEATTEPPQCRHRRSAGACKQRSGKFEPAGTVPCAR